MFKVLGGPVLTGPRGPVTGRAAYKRRTALLAVLAVARGRPVGRERILGLLWPEHPANAARHTLSESLYVLRRELGGELFNSVGDEVALSPAQLRSDVGAFEEALDEGRLEDAVAEYGGPLLEGFFVDGAPEFERWVDAERDRLARACAGALERLAERAEVGGRLVEAVEWWRSLAAHDPFSGRVALRLVQALDASGERAGALRAAALHAGRVREELEVEPGEALTAFVERLRAEAPATAPAPRRKPRVFEAEEPEVVEVPATGRPSAPRDEPGPAERGGCASAPADAEESRRPARRRRWAVAAAVVAVLGGVGVVAAVLWTPAKPPAPPQYDPRRIAVLYFDDDSRDGGLQYLANGLTGELIDKLSRVPALDVASRNAVRAYRDGRESLDALVERLQVGTVVEGSVQRSGDSVRVRVQLVDTGGRTPLRSHTVVRPMNDLFALETAVGEAISAALRRRLRGEVRPRRAASETGSGAALELVLRAEEARGEAGRLARSEHPLDRASARRVLDRADSLLVRAAAADPRWARPRVRRRMRCSASSATRRLQRRPSPRSEFPE